MNGIPESGASTRHIPSVGGEREGGGKGRNAPGARGRRCGCASCRHAQCPTSFDLHLDLDISTCSSQPLELVLNIAHSLDLISSIHTRLSSVRCHCLAIPTLDARNQADRDPDLRLEHSTPRPDLATPRASASHPFHCSVRFNSLFSSMTATILLQFLSLARVQLTLTPESHATSQLPSLVLVDTPDTM